MNPSAAPLASLKDIIVISPMIALLLISLIPIMLKVFNGNREPKPFVTVAYSLLGVMVAGGLTAALSGMKQYAFSESLIFDGMAVWGISLVLLAGAVGLILAYDHVETDGRQFSEQSFLMLGSMIGMIIVVMANDLIVTFLGIEMMSLCLYILVAMSRERVLSKEAAFKYFVLGSFASAIFLYGIALLYGTVGATQLPAIAGKTAELLGNHNQLFYIGLAMVILGFAFKVSVFPFHSWTPDVYQGAPTPITAFMATAVKAATFVAILRLFQHADPSGKSAFLVEPRFLTVISWLAVLTMVVGNAAALLQNNFKRILAYSSVSHSGYILVGVIAAGFADRIESSVAASTVVLFYLFSYSVMTLGSFALVAIMEKQVGHSLSVDDLKGLSKKNPVLAGSLALILFSLAGVPPTIGFFAKFSLFGAAIDQNLYWLAFWGVLNSVVAVYYYLRPVVVMYMAEPEGVIEARPAFLSRATLVLAAIATVILGIAASPILEFVSTSVLNRL
ncbi:MAG: NADH-quinone oxidoreductase subunit N [Bdellovibrionales bacterium]|jgi:NADH-quinone oxidoreductase subunit N|nr:NADH-quinone oxidoreductase subunit N [Bdellovibrionales bacterium]